MVYDADSTKFSRRLISLARTVNFRKNMCGIDEMFITKPVTLNTSYTFDNDKKIKEKLTDGCRIFGINVNITKLDLTRYYKKFGGTFPKGKRNVVLFTCQNDYLLGCY